MNSHPFYIAGDPVELTDLTIKLVNNETIPASLISTVAVQLEQVTLLGTGWYRLTDLYTGPESRTLLVFKTTDITTVLYRQEFESSRRVVLPSVRQFCLPTDPDAPRELRTVVVYGYVKDLNQSPLSGQTVKYKIEPAPQTVNDIILDKGFQSVLTSETGYFEFTVAGGLTITVVIPTANFQKTGTLPFSGRVEATTLDME